MEIVCHGIHFIAFRANWYLCSKENTAVKLLPKEGELCPVCEKPISSEFSRTASSHIEVETRKVAIVPDIGRVTVYKNLQEFDV